MYVHVQMYVCRCAYALRWTVGMNFQGMEAIHVTGVDYPTFYIMIIYPSAFRALIKY